MRGWRGRCSPTASWTAKSLEAEAPGRGVKKYSIFILILTMKLNLKKMLWWQGGYKAHDSMWDGKGGMCGVEGHKKAKPLQK